MNEDLRYLEAFIKDKQQTNHPTDKLLADFIDKKLTDEKRETIILHLIECYECREIVVNITKYGVTPIAVNLKKWSPVLLVSASLLLFIFLPFKDVALLGLMDLSKVEVTDFQNVSTSQRINQIIDADKILKEILASTSLKSIDYFNQALEAEKNNKLEEAKGWYNQAIMEIRHNPNATQRLKQKIVIHYELLKISHKEKNKRAIKEYKAIVRNEIRTYLLDYQKGKL
jgi:hypothetical protein